MNHFQIDLFNNNPDKVINALLVAFCEHNDKKAEQLIQLLQKKCPSHSQLFDLQKLLSAQQKLHLPIKDIQHELNELRYICLLAAKLLGKQSHSYLIPFWQHLAQYLQGQQFNPLLPELHCSFMYSEAMDWMKVQMAVENEPQWYEHPILILRLCKALYFLEELETALEVWFYLFWQFPPEAVTAISSSSNPHLALRERWQAFEYLEEELNSTSFPAWMLLTDSKLIHYSATKSLPVLNVYAKNYNAIRKALLLKQSKTDNFKEVELELRLALKNADEGLLKWYLQRLRS